jgi:hypothetical protein
MMEFGGGGADRAASLDDVVDAQLPSGALVHLRVADQQQGLENVGRLSAQDLQEAFGTIEEVAGMLKDKLVSIAPTRASVQFAVSFSMKGGHLVALLFDGKAEAALTVTLEWDRQGADQA